MSVEKEGKVLEQKKLLQPLLATLEGTEMGCIIFFFTSSTMTVYSNIQFVKSGQKIWAGPSPPLNWTKSKRTATFFGRPSPREPSVLIISSHPIFCARFLNHWTIMHAILFLIFSAAQFWTLSDVWRWATENFTTFGNWKRATEIARKFKKMSNGEFYNFGALKKSCGD